MTDQLKDKILKVRDLEAMNKDHVDAMYSKPSHRARKRALDELMSVHVRDKDFLDVGCAEGIYCNEAHRLGAKRVIGVDVSPKKIARAKELYPMIEFKISDSDDISRFLDSKFDFILCTEVLQHILEYKKTIKEVLSLLRDPGFLLISVPNLSNSDDHVFAQIDDNMSVEDLLKEIGGAGYGKQNAIWKFNTNMLEKEFISDFNLDVINKIAIDTPDGALKNLWTVFLLKKRI